MYICLPNLCLETCRVLIYDFVCKYLDFDRKINLVLLSLYDFIVKRLNFSVQ